MGVDVTNTGVGIVVSFLVNVVVGLVVIVEVEEAEGSFCYEHRVGLQLLSAMV